MRHAEAWTRLVLPTAAAARAFLAPSTEPVTERTEGSPVRRWMMGAGASWLAYATFLAAEAERFGLP